MNLHSTPLDKTKTAVKYGIITSNSSKMARYYVLVSQLHRHQLMSCKTSTTWEKQQKMDALCKIYHSRAVQIPLENVEKLWSEQNHSPYDPFIYCIWLCILLQAKQFMSDLSSSYMQAQTVQVHQFQRHLGPLFPPPPPPSSSRPLI